MLFVFFWFQNEHISIRKCYKIINLLTVQIKAECVWMIFTFICENCYTLDLSSYIFLTRTFQAVLLLIISVRLLTNDPSILKCLCFWNAKTRRIFRNFPVFFCRTFTLCSNFSFLFFCCITRSYEHFSLP